MANFADYKKVNGTKRGLNNMLITERKRATFEKRGRSSVVERQLPKVDKPLISHGTVDRN